MAQIDELVKRARTIGEIADNDLSAAIDIGDECADAIDRLQARVAELEKEATRLAEQVRGYNSVVVKRTADRDSLRAKLDQPPRNRLPDTRVALNHKFDIAGHEGYITVGLFENGQPGELFIQMAKEGSTIGGLMDTVATLTSISLQYGVPLESLVKKFAFQRFEPSGFTKNPDIRNASSITDYVFRWLGCQFIKGYKEATSPNRNQPELPMKEIPEMERRAVNQIGRAHV
jgi:ribonucleoside-diphosphate reductase alpha chain